MRGRTRRPQAAFRQDRHRHHEDPNPTVDTWIAGGLQFANGAAYSYVVLVGTGSTREPFGRSLHAAQVASPLLEVLLKDLEPKQRPAVATAPTAAPVTGKAVAKPATAPPQRKPRTVNTDGRDARG